MNKVILKVRYQMIMVIVILMMTAMMMLNERPTAHSTVQRPPQRQSVWNRRWSRTGGRQKMQHHGTRAQIPFAAAFVRMGECAHTSPSRFFLFLSASLQNTVCVLAACLPPLVVSMTLELFSSALLFPHLCCACA